MKKIWMLAIAGLLSTGLFAQTTDPTQNPTDCSNAFFTAMLNEDATAVGKVTTDDFSLVNYDGQVVDKDLLIQAVGGGYVVIETSAVSAGRTRTYNDNAAIISGSWKSKGAVQGQNFDAESYFTVMCVKQNGGWKVASVQLTSIR